MDAARGPISCSNEKTTDMEKNDRRKFIAGLAGATALGTPLLAGATPREVASGDANVRDFGAAGDGKRDDTKAIQAAVDAARGAVFFPKGTYRVTRTIEVDLDRLGFTSIFGNGSSKIIMQGPGAVFRFKGTHQKSAAPSGFSDSVWDRERMPMIENVAIVGDHPEAEGVEAIGTMQLTITRLHVRSALHAIHLRGNNRNLIVTDCHLYHNRGIGIYYDDVNLHQSNITGCHISYNSGGGIVARGGAVRNIHITGCDIESNMGKESPPTANVLIDCSTSQWGTAEVAITGCTIQHNSTSPGSTNIRIIGSTEVGGTLRKWGNTTITGNILSDVMVNIHLTGCRGVTISNNTVWEGFKHHLILEDCSHIVIGNNLFDQSPNIAREVQPEGRLEVVNCEDCTFNGVQIVRTKGVAALVVKNSKRINISNCHITDCLDAGLLIRNVSDSIVMGCIIKNQQPSSAFTALKQEGSNNGNIIVNNLL